MKAKEYPRNEDEIALIGENIRRVLLKTAEGYGVDHSVCIGQGYNGAVRQVNERVLLPLTKITPKMHTFLIVLCIA